MLIVQNTKKLLEHIFPTAETKLGMQGYMPRQLSEATNKVPNIEILDSQFEYKLWKIKSCYGYHDQQCFMKPANSCYICSHLASGIYQQGFMRRANGCFICSNLASGIYHSL